MVVVVVGREGERRWIRMKADFDGRAVDVDNAAVVSSIPLFASIPCWPLISSA